MSLKEASGFNSEAENVNVRLYIRNKGNKVFVKRAAMDVLLYLVFPFPVAAFYFFLNLNRCFLFLFLLLSLLFSVCIVWNCCLYTHRLKKMSV